MDHESQARQHERDMAYLRACREAGIEPDLPDYKIRSNVGHDIEKMSFGQLDNCGTHNNGSALTRLPLNEIEVRELEAEQEAKRPERDKIMREAMSKVLDVLLVGASPGSKYRLADRARASALRVITMAWMVGRGTLAGISLSELAKQLGCTRAALSWHARKLEQFTGFHARGQKMSETVPKYRAARVRYLQRCEAEGIRPTTSARKAKHPPAGEG